MLKIIPNPDKEMYDLATKAVKAADGYCPCRISRTPETLCICQDFKEQSAEGVCCCGRFAKVEVADHD